MHSRLWEQSTRLTFRALCLALITCACVAQPPVPQARSSPHPLAIQKFELYHNRVYLPVIVNGTQTLTVVLDSGAAMSAFSEATAQRLQLPTKGKAQADGNGDKRLPITFTKNVRFDLGEARLSEASVAVIPFKEFETHEGRTVEGILGVDLFRRYIVDIDYRAHTIALYDPQSYTDSGTGQVVPLHFKGDAALFATSVIADGHLIPAELAIDSGTYSGLRLYAPFVQRHNLLSPGGKTVSGFGFGLGGEFAEQQGTVDALEIGALHLQSPETSFSTAHHGVTASSAYDGTIGGAILRSFHVIFDYPHSRLILEEN